MQTFQKLCLYYQKGNWRQIWKQDQRFLLVNSMPTTPKLISLAWQLPLSSFEIIWTVPSDGCYYINFHKRIVDSIQNYIWNMQSIPVDVWTKIVPFLDEDSFFNLCIANKHLSRTLDDERIWVRWFQIWLIHQQLAANSLYQINDIGNYSSWKKIVQHEGSER